MTQKTCKDVHNCPLWVSGSANADLIVTVSFKDLVDTAESLWFGSWVIESVSDLAILISKTENEGFKSLV